MTETTGGEEGGEKSRPHPRLVTVGVVVTIVASVAGLLTTGVATLFGALVAQDQLEQSRDLDEEKLRAQAARVSYWMDQQDGVSRVHLTNRSPDPISDVRLHFELAPNAEGHGQPVWFNVAMPSVPPCSDTAFTAGDMGFSAEDGEEEQSGFSYPLDRKLQKSYEKVSEEVFSIWMLGADFRDRDGVRWRRDQGLLVRDPKDSKPEHGVTGYVFEVPPQQLKSCGELDKISE
ncbi:hypothetical protein ACFQ9Q_38250 [Streptomyces virginiae]|uniref:hypothetical protein n=1 Tax=Streptomyces virginiae TaxID=1961 RepID=UPI0036758281